MITNHILLVPPIATLLVDEHRGHQTEMIQALAAARERFRADPPDVTVVLSARWMTTGPFMVDASPRHKTITDYTGFGVEVRYDCPGHPEVARALVHAGQKAGVRTAAASRGVDSGVSVPMHFLSPARRLNVVPISIAPADAAACRTWGAVLRGVLAERPERAAFIVGGMLSNDEHAWSLRRDVPETGEFDEAALEAMKQGAWHALPTGNAALAARAKPQAELRHLEVLRGFLGADLPGVVQCYEAGPGVGAALVEFHVPGVEAPAPGE